MVAVIVGEFEGVFVTLEGNVVGAGVSWEGDGGEVGKPVVVVVVIVTVGVGGLVGKEIGAEDGGEEDWNSVGEFDGAVVGEATGDKVSWEGDSVVVVVASAVGGVEGKEEGGNDWISLGADVGNVDVAEVGETLGSARKKRSKVRIRKKSKEKEIKF